MNKDSNLMAGMTICERIHLLGSSCPYEDNGECTFEKDGKCVYEEAP